MPSGTLRAAAIGSLTHDLHGSRIRAGGSAFYAAHAWLALGASPTLFASAGTDFTRDEDLRGLDVRLSRQGRTITFLNRDDEHGRTSRIVAGDAPSPDPATVPPDFACDAVLLAPVMGEVSPESWIDVFVCDHVGLVLQGLVRERGVADDAIEGGRLVVARAPRLSPAVLERLTLVVLSEDDLRGLDAAAILDTLRRHVEIVGVTRGREGSVIYAGGMTWDVGVCPARVVDTTGAGDVFGATLLLELAAGADIPYAARAASAAASVIVEGEAADCCDRLRISLDERMNSVSVCAR